MFVRAFFLLLISLSLFATATAAIQKPTDEDAALTQRAYVIFGKLLKSDAAGKKFVDDLYAYSLKSPWQYGTIVQLSQRLVSNGYKKEDVLPLLKPCGDAAVGLRVEAEDTDFARLVGEMYDVKNEPSQVAINIAALEREGLPAIQILSEATGEPKEKIIRLANDNRLRAPMVYKILLEGFEVH